MKKSISITLGTMLVPTLMLGAGTAIAGQQEADAIDRTANVGQTQGGDNFMTTRPGNAFYADQLIGTNVRGQGDDDDDFGAVDDLIIGEDGQIQAVIVNVGGFLGMGDRDVAISWDALDVRRDRDDDSGMGTGWFGDDYVIRANISSQQMENAPEFERDRDNDGIGTGTGTGTGAGGIGTGGTGTDGATGVGGGQQTGNVGEGARTNN